MSTVQMITPCLWFADQAEDAAAFYTGIFPNSRIKTVTRYGQAGQDTHGRPPGSVLTVDFELDGQPFTALNGGPVFTFNEAISPQAPCATQEDIDCYWDKLTPGGDPSAQQCGWLNAMAALLRMKKPDMAELKRAYEG